MRAYLDHASTSPLRPVGREAALRWMSAADPGRIHTEGRMARAALEDARSSVASLFGTRPRQVIFTSGATEAINAASFGALRETPGAVALADVEHSAVREASARWGTSLVPLGVDRTGRLLIEQVARALASEPSIRLVQCQLANHEVGTLQPVAEVARLCRSAGVLLHVDAAAAAGHVPIDFDGLEVDLMSVSAHKMGGPGGIGALLVRRGLRIPPSILGGAQERGRRGGMENVAGAVGFGAVAEYLRSPAAARESESEAERQPWGRSVLEAEAGRAGALTGVEGVTAYGPRDAGFRLPHLVCVGVEGVEAEGVLVGLDRAGVAAHSGSACSSEMLEPSPVLAAMGAQAERSLRMSVGWSTTAAEVDLAARAFPEVVEGLRRLRAT